MDSDRPLDVPLDRHYDGAQHLWARLDETSGLVRIGVDSIGLESLGELAYVSLEAVGTTVARGGSLGTLEAAKMTSHVVAPVGGTIVERNDAVLRDPLAVNGDPYDGGWLVAIEPSGWERDSAELVSGDAIAGWAAGEIEKLRARVD